MKILVACRASPLVVPGIAALPQADPMERLRVCSTLPPAERVECLDKLSRDIGPPPASAASVPTAEPGPAADNWIVSQTTSPFDYSPIAIATASTTSGLDGVALQLSIQCRGGGTELVLGSTPPTLRGEGYAATYRIDDGGPVQVATGTPASGTGIAIKGDLVRLLAGAPHHGPAPSPIPAPPRRTLASSHPRAILYCRFKRLS